MSIQIPDSPIVRRASLALTIALVFVLAAASASCSQPAAKGGSETSTAVKPMEKGDSSMGMQLTSPSFEAKGEIPRRFTCEGEDTSPPLAWSGAPEGTKSLALIVDDPDAPDPKAPKVTWVHWVLYNLPPAAGELVEGADKSGLPEGTERGRNSWNKAAYGGPCPPIGRHRYFFKLYALDIRFNHIPQPDKDELEAVMRGHILAQAELMGTYQK